MKFHVLTALALLTLSLIACAPRLSEGPPAIQRVAVPDALIHTNGAARTQAENVSQSQWWRVFGNQDLDRLVAMALDDNPGLAEASARVHLAQAEVLRAGAAEWPHLDSTNTITRGHNSENGNHGIYNDKTATVSEIDPLVVSYHLDVWGEDSEMIAAAKAGAEVARARYRQSALMLSAAVIKTYFGLYTADKLVSTQEQIVELNKAAENVQRAAYQAGIETPAASLGQKVDIANAESALAQLQLKKTALRYALADLLGKNPDYKLSTPPLTHPIPASVPIPQRIDLNLIAQRPDIEVALWNIRHAAHLEKAAQDKYYPNINLRALAGFNSIGLSNLFEAGSFTYAFGPAINLPIFEGGALKGGLQAGEARYEAAVFAYNRAVLAAVKQIATDLASLEYSKEQLSDKDRALGQSAALVKVAAAQFASGIDNQLPYLQARIKHSNALKAHMEETLNWLYAITDTATALGGGFQRWPS